MQLLQLADFIVNVMFTTAENILTLAKKMTSNPALSP